MTEYFAYSFLSGFSSDTGVRTLLNKYDYYIFPVVNPDGMLLPLRLSIKTFPFLGGLTGCDGTGFVYTQTNDRLWRKNRQSTSGSSCLGHDINRNWNYQWATPGGASTDPCAQDFKGKLPSRTAADANCMEMDADG